MFSSRTSQEAWPTSRLPVLFQAEVAYPVIVLAPPTSGRNQFSAPLRGSVPVGGRCPAAHGNHRNQGRKS